MQKGTREFKNICTFEEKNKHKEKKNKTVLIVKIITSKQDKIDYKKKKKL